MDANGSGRAHESEGGSVENPIGYVNVGSDDVSHGDSPRRFGVPQESAEEAKSNLTRGRKGKWSRRAQKGAAALCSL